MSPQVADAQVVGLCTGLSKAETDRVMLDWSTARREFAAILSAKTSVWQQLPLRLAGLAHFDRAEVRATAAVCLQMYPPDADPELHHPLSNLFLQPGGSWRASVEALARGVATVAELVVLLRLRPLKEGQFVIVSCQPK